MATRSSSLVLKTLLNLALLTNISGTATSAQTMSDVKVGPSLAQADSTALTGQMAVMNYLLGTPWSCSTSVPANGDLPERTYQSTIAFDVAPGNVIHDHVSGVTYSEDAFYGYDPKSKTYWTNNATNMGAHGYQTSLDGRTFTGASWIGESSTQTSTVFEKINANRIAAHEVSFGNGKHVAVDSVCMR